MTKTILVTVGGKPVELLKRTHRHRLKLESMEAMWSKDRRAHNLSLAGYDSEEITRRLSEFDKKHRPDIIEYINSGQGMLDALELSASECDDPSVVVDSIMDDGRGLEILAEIWGFSIVPRTDEPEETADPQLPEAWPTPPANPSFVPSTAIE